MKKTLTFVVIILFASIGSLRAQMELLPNTPYDTYFCASHPIHRIVYLAGGQAVYKSEDNGDSWATVYTFDTMFNARFFGMWFWDEHTGFASCAKIGKKASAWMSEAPSLPQLFKTEDGGMSWQCVDTSHTFTKIQFVSRDTLYALSLEENVSALHKSVDGGISWSIVLGEEDICDYSVVNNQVIYALHGTTYFSDVDLSTQPNPTVFKSSDGGSSWITIHPTDSSKGPRKMDQIFFYEDGKGVILGHDIMFTENDFSTFETASAGFPSAPDGWNIQNSTLKGGFQISTSLADLDMAGYSRIRISRDYGLHSQLVGTPQFVCESVGCEADTSFIIVTLGNVYRAKGTDFPNVGVPERPSVECLVSPNPTMESLTISCGVPIFRVEVYDLQGRIVWSQQADKCNEIPVLVSCWENGTYLLLIYTEKGMITEKIVKL